MLSARTITAALFLLCMFTVKAQLPADNPLLVHSNQPIQFNKIDASAIMQATAAIITLSDNRIQKIAAVPAKARTVSNTLMAYDELNYDINDLESKLYLISSTFSDDSTRNAGTAQLDKIVLYATNLTLNESLYKAVKEFQRSVKTVQPDQQKYLRESLQAFELNGMKLDSAGRKNLAAINEKLVTLGTAFDNNISESKDSLSFTAADLKGIPNETIVPWKRAGGTYMVTVNGPNAINISLYADSDSTRKIMYLHYNNRAYPKNINVLDSLFFYRQKFATALGFKSYADYALATKMAFNPTNVWNFENNLISKLEPGVTEDLKELRDLKHSLHPELADTIYAWDIPYYKNILLNKKYNVNNEEIKQYFEINNTVKGMFSVFEKLFGIQIKQTTGVPVWSPKVTSYEMFKDGKKMGIFYLDLFPRPNKYTHFECALISAYRNANGKEILPVSTLICNFPESTPQQPSLLLHSDVVTMFHEFGHLVHSLLGEPRVSEQNINGVKGDFVEAPSQFLENFCWQYEPLKMLSKNYKTGEPMPRDLFAKLKATEHVLDATYYMRQLYFGVLDFTYENKYDSIQSQSIMDVSKNLFAITQIPYPEGSHFICSFTHLSGYGANYYGYLWSKVFAQDIFSVFQKNGIMDVPTGIRYRKEILEKGATIEEMDMLRNFLGREPNNTAFLESLNIK